MSNFIEHMKNDFSVLIKTGLAHIVSSSVVNKVISFAGGIILVRLISKDAYGVYSYANNLLGFFMIVSGLGATAAVLQLCSEVKNIGDRVKFYKFGCVFGLSFNTVLGVIVLGGSLFINLPINGANYYLALMCFLPLVHLLSDLLIMYLRTELKNKEYAWSNMICTFIHFICIIIFSYLFQATGLIFAQYISYLLSSVLIIFLFNVPFSLEKPNISKSDLNVFFSISGISVINNGLSKLMYLLDIFVLGLVMPNDSIIASYKVATHIPTALSFVPASIVVYIYPYFARNKDNKKWVIQTFKKIIQYLGLFNAIVVIGLCIIAPKLISFVFGEQYLDAVPVFRVLCISYFFSGTFRSISGNLLVTQRKLKFNLFVSFVSGVLNLILNYYLIKTFGPIGAAWSTLITAIFCAIVSTTYLLFTFNRISGKMVT